MSIRKKRFSLAVLLLAEILSAAILTAAQDIKATIKFVSPAMLKIEGKLIKPEPNRTNRQWFFRHTIAEVENLGRRIAEFGLSDGDRKIAVRKLADGEYLAENAADSFSYQLDLTAPPSLSAMPHVSWIAGERGILMLDDLLPQTAENRIGSAEIEFVLPIDWKIISAAKPSGSNAFTVDFYEKAIFAVGKNWREQEIQIGRSAINLAISGEWQFSDAEAINATNEILLEYQKLFGEMPTVNTQIFLARAPDGTKLGRWKAETRGRNVTIVSAAMPFKNQALQLLQEQLRHELFHLWLPNNLALSGNYDWFYEGFAIYQALRTGVAINQIRFEDFLDTLAQAYRLDNFQDAKVSLIESSKNRWSGANNRVYARGMLGAFLCDVALLRASKGKRSITEIFREVYRKHRIPNEPEDGNSAILKILQSYPQLNAIVEKYLKGTEKINWETDLESIGIENEKEDFSIRLKVKAKLDGRERDLLDVLGYNNWRKISGKRK